MYYLKRILGCIKKADNDYHLFENGDKIAIGVSGGKDSMLLLNALTHYKKMLEKEKSIELVAIHVDLGFPNTNLDALKEYANSVNVPLVIVPSDIASMLNEHKENNGRLPCSICSRMRKAVINKAAIDNGCNKVAFAHHGDDAIETLVMNAIYGGRIATFAPKMHLDKTNLTFIRPLIYAREKEIIRVTNKMGIPVIKSTCPNDSQTMRQEIKNMLKKLYRKYPSARDNFLLMLHNKEQLDLWEPINEKEID